MYYIYILRCHDGSLYTGITTNIQRRFQEHLLQGKKAAKYTRTHHVQSIAAYWSCQDRKASIKIRISNQKTNQTTKRKYHYKSVIFFYILKR